MGAQGPADLLALQRVGWPARRMVIISNDYTAAKSPLPGDGRPRAVSDAA
ncbi:hypothetical protein ASZ90_000662 [hydrocarbon metagenome]|uniref:Uncharacterized protein n=1 Tax=hydrocarbon metagenome TaxID=938273 RepID=A0A0W8G8F9_9ZZZZ